MCNRDHSDAWPAGSTSEAAIVFQRAASVLAFFCNASRSVALTVRLNPAAAVTGLPLRQLDRKATCIQDHTPWSAKLRRPGLGRSAQG